MDCPAAALSAPMWAAPAIHMHLSPNACMPAASRAAVGRAAAGSAAGGSSGGPPGTLGSLDPVPLVIPSGMNRP